MRARSSLRDFKPFVPPFPALKRWAKLGRPSGAGFQDISFHWIARKRVLTNTLKRCATQDHAKLRTASLIPFSYAEISLSRVAFTWRSICLREGSALNHARDCRIPSAKVVVAQ